MLLLLFMFAVIVISKATEPLENNFELYHGKDNYCYCGMVDGQPDGWNPKGIWLDMYIIFDTSISMTDHLEEAKSMVSSFVTQINTNRSTRIHSRIGVIDASFPTKMVYDLNMNFTDTLDSIKLTNATNANVDTAILTAIRSFSVDYNYQQQIATIVQRVVYYVTATSADLTFDQSIYFKSHGGIIIVNDFGSDEGTTNLGLRELASHSYYFTDLSLNYMRNLEVLCEANCWCGNPYIPFNDYERNPRTQANRGCYELEPYGDTHAKARKYCSRMGAEIFPVQGSLVSIHDQDKDVFVSGLASYPPKTKYWIALENNGSAWNWEDESSDPFADWADGQPNTNDGQSMCAYARQAVGLNVEWSAADCHDELAYVCETAPCSVGYLCMPCLGCSW